MTATSVADPTKTAQAVVTLLPPITVAVTPAASVLYGGQVLQLAALITNSPAGGVSWSVVPAGAGTVDASGLYSAPAVISARQDIAIVATSVVNPQVSAAATVTLLPPIRVSVAPLSSVLYEGQTQQFSAVVDNAINTSVVWSVGGAGSVNGAGLYTAPSNITSQQTVTLTATSAAPASVSASATITLEPPVAVSVSPAATTLYAGQTQQLTASVVNSNNTSVTWSASPAGAGSISATGLYSAPASIATSQAVTLTATSAADPTKTASATITLLPPVTVSISPVSANLYGGQTLQLSAVVANSSNPGVNWAAVPAGVGTVDGSGFYSAPAIIANQQVVTVTATSVANPQVSASSTLMLLPPIAIMVSPANATLYAGQTQQFSASVTNGGSAAVMWSLGPGAVGSINSAGVYSAPASIAAEQSFTVIATSQTDASNIASATITLSPAHSGMPGLFCTSSER